MSDLRIPKPSPPRHSVVSRDSADQRRPEFDSRGDWGSVLVFRLLILSKVSEGLTRRLPRHNVLLLLMLSLGPLCLPPSVSSPMGATLVYHPKQPSVTNSYQTNL
ncbi:unnamed protein product [Meganyctiphanes norvegica]|uniref:Uncharacterized protein n=1 Tax=Meganyctiphanes norvegica TaxID=48144 RepID=A0AAV2PLU0_MEGNR